MVETWVTLPMRQVVHRPTASMQARIAVPLGSAIVCEQQHNQAENTIRVRCSIRADGQSPNRVSAFAAAARENSQCDRGLGSRASLAQLLDLLCGAQQPLAGAARIARAPQHGDAQKFTSAEGRNVRAKPNPSIAQVICRLMHNAARSARPNVM